jgi:hypothetical protein
MAAKSFRLRHRETGDTFVWKFRRDEILRGWVLTDHDGYERFRPGTWLDFVPFAKLVAENHGLDCPLS